MSVPLLFLIFVAVLVIAARLLLRDERRPPLVPDEDPTTGFRDPSIRRCCRPFKIRHHRI